MASEKEAGWPARIWAAVGGGLTAVVGLALVAGGVWLVGLGGSPYYLLAGAGVAATGGLLVRRHPAAGLVYGVVLIVTAAWALWESGLEFWPLLPRLFAPAVLGFFILAVIPTGPKGRLRGQSAAAVLLTSLGCLCLLAAALPATLTWGQAETPAQALEGAPSAKAASDWRDYGHDPLGTRYAPLDQINRENVDHLQVAWTFRTGEKPNKGSQDQNTPLQVGDTVYVCTPTNVVIALDPDTGKEKWRHDPHVKPHFWNRCRGVGYWDGTTPSAAAAKPAAPAATPAKPPAKPAPAKVQ
ncbi:MAG TPA: hypothetical protein VFH92_10275, partial [Phenylobacterium sp.]|nr:hypothetical protein [Phenylobacterium sp.]